MTDTGLMTVEGDSMDVTPAAGRTPAARLRSRITGGGHPLLAPGAANALTARIAEDLGAEAVYVTGAGVANTFLGSPDIGLTGMSEVRDHIAAIRDAVEVPIIADGDTGFGNAIGVGRTVRQYERAGASGIQLEDQAWPKKCGHFEGKAIVALDEMVGKIHAAVDARDDDDFVVIARPDAIAVDGFDAAIDRANVFADEGADVVFVEGPRTEEQLLAIPDRVVAPTVANMVEGGVTPLMPLDRLHGFSLVLYANAALQGAIHGTRVVLDSLLREGDLSAVLDRLAPWSERQALVRKPHFDALESRYAAAATGGTR
jgi:2-methylisocitrate lyase-like PEP mutase family enzyme